MNDASPSSAASFRTICSELFQRQLPVAQRDSQQREDFLRGCSRVASFLKELRETINRGPPAEGLNPYRVTCRDVFECANAVCQHAVATVDELQRYRQLLCVFLMRASISATGASC